MRIRVEETWTLHFEDALLTKKFAELEKSLEIIMAKQTIFAQWLNNYHPWMFRYELF